MNYNELKLTARQLLKEFGREVSLIRRTGDTYTPDNGLVKGTEQTIRGPAVNFPFKKSDRLRPDTLIQAGDEQVIIELSVKPRSTDLIDLDGVVYSIIDVENIAPAGVNVIYILHARL